MKKIVWLLALAILVSGCAKHRGLTIDEKTTVNSLLGQTYYTQTNIWFSDLDNGKFNQFHKGSVLPVGSKVKLIECSGGEIKFSDETGMSYLMVNSLRSTIDLMTFFNRYFSKENVMSENGRFSKFTKQEQDNIKKNTIDYDMSKEAVLMAYGYPPAQKDFTPDTRSNQWRYLEDYNRRTYVYFKNNMVIKIEDTRPGHRRPFKPIKQKATLRANKGQQDVSGEKASSADEILKYKKLLDSGAITNGEYEQKKKQLLGLD